MGMITVPGIKGLLLTPGYINYQMGGGTARVISIGAIYYHNRMIVSGGIGFNTTKPGDMNSVSGDFGIMYDQAQKYYLGGGLRGGNLAYQLVSTIPFDVRLNSYSASTYFSKWIGRNWGLTPRYEQGDVITSYRSNVVSLSLFWDF
jgi:YaiO family outer membrane protein